MPSINIKKYKRGLFDLQEKKAYQFIPIILMNSFECCRIAESSSKFNRTWSLKNSKRVSKSAVLRFNSVFSLKKSINEQEYFQRVKKLDIPRPILLFAAYLYLKIVNAMSCHEEQLKNCSIKIFATCISIAEKIKSEDISITYSDNLGFKSGKIALMQKFALSRILKNDFNLSEMGYVDFCRWVNCLPQNIFKVKKDELLNQ